MTKSPRFQPLTFAETKPYNHIIRLRRFLSRTAVILCSWFIVRGLELGGRGSEIKNQTSKIKTTDQNAKRGWNELAEGRD
jgi:hypothetical protein